MKYKVIPTNKFKKEYIGYLKTETLKLQLKYKCILYAPALQNAINPNTCNMYRLIVAFL